ncbi:MAG: zinc-ribbon domain-containing protein [Lachnospiraceae bacterium]|nr:zinc-ribbon domain-containing protein [Lachnospiraceae bacterium]MBQ2040576.1 zinc-ribbon domain-containing protein [Lachnospiraceae bacterium]
MALNINSIIILIFMAFIVGGFGYARWRVRKLSKQIFGKEDIIDGLKQAKIDADASPKSLASLTKILLPQIQKDFPAFNWQEYREKVRQAVRKCIRDMHDDPEEIELHETEIADYRNNSNEGTCFIICQTSAGYRNESGNWIERKYETDLAYVQDVSQLPPTQTAVGLNCPNCGAPIKMLGRKTCPYCGTGITELNIRVWRVNGTKEFGN